MFVAFWGLAQAFTVQTVPGTDTPVFWGQMPLDYTFVDDTRLPPGGSSAVARAFEAWSEVQGSEASFDPSADHGAVPQVDYDDHQLVFLADEWPYGDDALAIASVWSNDDSGELMHFDIRVNPTVDWAIDGDGDCFDLESAVTHEVGHVLGLEHSEFDDAAMFGILAPGHLRRGLHEDDEEGLRFLYPAQDEASATCSTAGPAAGWLALSLGALAFRRRT